MIKRSPAGGFSLIELMVALAVVAVIAAVAMPNYTEFVKRSNRSEGTRALIVLANAQEQHYMANQTYASAIGNLPVQPLTENNHYLLSVVAGNGLAFVLQADPNGAGTGDSLTDDGKLRISSTGVQQWDCENDNSWACDWEDAARKGS
ncbi:MAG: prepilin-type N-terminal cleavage/methylation domain-containing protein [Gammaproteobacteria bacterium]|nr:prepilin-type N-terminal cleavage/methylation domain-containing protein [Gammaproteobacteria bacterium]